MKAFSVQMIDLDLFFQYLKDIAMATDFVQKKANSPLSSLWHSATYWDIDNAMGALTAQMMHCVKIV